ncbi:UvrD-helicase domain-containing protein [Mucilaginibacter sp. OK283]|jgi:superfamily I DNA/RNA helicase|uniref:UvrD-helicase domain-containing protein n=1 Tax=Mucilaginibacter sp. OK283 TaxID=1881049 RepID=UPI0008AFB128|nr:ATP-dependent helicase [Mucilaginibacter sp. OK283]SEO77258.1 Superfamily I DNA or RNA helicase [Mucilaginibacter sp. OK283]
MIKAIKKEDWVPADGFELEDNALTVVKSTGNSLVLAGPGAGKTELLAQRASYLLQTNACTFPGKILAISFKRDAAFNLRERVKLRCGDDLSRRFDSMTFDSFAKQILDRFKMALPSDYSIDADYEISMKDTETLSYYQLADPDNNYDQRQPLALATLKKHTASSLPLHAKGAANRLRKEVWKSMLAETPSKLNFKMIMRLAELIINKNPKIKAYLQQTYQYVFLDEFQDATDLQYDFFKACFLGSDSIYTAVGDDKQRIMLWAGALDAVFEDFMNDTGAAKVSLKMNFRCAPRLVKLLNHLTEHLLGKDDFATPSKKWDPDAGECFVWVYNNPQEEMQSLLEEVKSWVDAEGLNLRDICILVKQQLGSYAGGLIRYFNEHGVKARDENAFQDLLTQEITQYIVSALYLIFGKKQAEYKKTALSFLSNIHTEFEDEQLLRLESSFHQFIKKATKSYAAKEITEDLLSRLIEEIVSFAGRDRIKAFYPAYKNVKYLNDLIKDILEKMVESGVYASDMPAALDQLTGKDTIPVMTVHKSKGLEYHTVIFIGLEDGAFWKFQDNPDEDKCTFFVALSRAKQRVVFTFCHQRPDKNGRMRSQSTENIGEILATLESSKIVTIEEKNK